MKAGRKEPQHYTYEQIRDLVKKVDRVLLDVRDCAGNAATSVEVNKSKLMSMLAQSSAHCYMATLDERPEEKVLWIE